MGPAIHQSKKPLRDQYWRIWEIYVKKPVKILVLACKLLKRDNMQNIMLSKRNHMAKRQKKKSRIFINILTEMTYDTNSYGEEFGNNWDQQRLPEDHVRSQSWLWDGDFEDSWSSERHSVVIIMLRRDWSLSISLTVTMYCFYGTWNNITHL